MPPGAYFLVKNELPIFQHQEREQARFINIRLRRGKCQARQALSIHMDQGVNVRSRGADVLLHIHKRRPGDDGLRAKLRQHPQPRPGLL